MNVGFISFRATFEGESQDVPSALFSRHWGRGTRIFIAEESSDTKRAKPGRYLPSSYVELYSPRAAYIHTVRTCIHCNTVASLSLFLAHVPCRRLESRRKFPCDVLFRDVIPSALPSFLPLFIGPQKATFLERRR